MNTARKALTTLGGIFLAALLLTALAPRAARGVAAALVQVVNTTANPVPDRDVDMPGRHAVTLGFDDESDSGSAIFTNLDQTPFVVPSGKRLVVESVNGVVELLHSTLTNGGYYYVSCGVGTGTNAYTSNVNVVPQATFFPQFFVFTSSARLYCDAGATPSIGGLPEGNLIGAGGRLVGYFIDCSSAPCDPNSGGGN
ncbi:MAG: hypothetical protein WCA00_01655 [Candidatus Acidiferrales bacterium]